MSGGCSYRLVCRMTFFILKDFLQITTYEHTNLPFMAILMSFSLDVGVESSVLCVLRVELVEVLLVMHVLVLEGL